MIWMEFIVKWRADRGCHFWAAVGSLIDGKGKDI